MNTISYVIYSHTDFIDVLNFQTEYLEGISNKILLINKSSYNLTHIYSRYKTVIFYEDSLPYASRLLSLSQLNEKYILLIHDIDILIKRDDEIINWFVKMMETENIDRIDLQVRHSYDLNNNNSENINLLNHNFLLKQQTNVNNYIYNVQPSIWKLSSLCELMTAFKDETYRTIEVKCQEFCLKYKIYKLFSENYVKCGWISCLPFFQYIHITHHGKLFPNLNDKKLDKHLECDYYRMIDVLRKNREISKR